MINNARRKLKKLISFTISNRLKYVEINLTKEARDLYTENERLLKEIRDTNRKTPMFMDWKINIVKILMLPKLMYRFHAIPIKISMVFCWVFFVEVEKKSIITFIDNL